MDDKKPIFLKGRGAQINFENRFVRQQQTVENPEVIDVDEDDIKYKTKFLEVFPKTLVNVIKSPDLNMFYSVNPYQGCEHGCTYCYARPTHEYWGYGPGIDFETNILVKKNAPDLLIQKFHSKNYRKSIKPISVSGNTDCYQPAEKIFKLTRAILEICLEYRHPVSIITKNALVLRDVDILKEMAEFNLIHVNMSITTLDEKLRLALEPRTSTAIRKLEVLRTFSQAGIPVNVMMAPVIPGINDMEVMKIVKTAAENGAQNIHYQIVRLNGPNGAIFADWLEKYFPDRKEKVLHQIQDLHGGKLNDSRFGLRMKGEGNFALNIKRQFEIAKNKYFPSPHLPVLNTELFYIPNQNAQLELF